MRSLFMVSLSVMLICVAWVANISMSVCFIHISVMSRFPGLLLPFCVLITYICVFPISSVFVKYLRTFAICVVFLLFRGVVSFALYFRSFIICWISGLFLFFFYSATSPGS